MVFRLGTLRALVLSLLILPPCVTSAQNGPSLHDLSRWPMESVEFDDGRRLDGLIRHVDRRSVELVEVRRPPGRSMFLLVHWIPREQVGKLRRLPSAERDALRETLGRFRNRTAIAQAARDAISLTRRHAEQGEALHYRGSWFTADSWADEALTRESIARIEQFFAGYRTILPTRISPSRPLRLVIVPSVDAYLEFQRRTHQSVRNPAYFDPVRNEIVVGGNLAEFASRLGKARLHHEQLVATQETQAAQLRMQIKVLTDAFEGQGTDVETVRQLSVAIRRQWQRLTETQQRKIRQARRANDRMFDEQFRVLYHEAFHAYLDNYVYDRDHFRVPRWLNEGWAQIFESGQLDAGTLRLDAPSAKALEALQKDWARETPLGLATLLRAPEKQFLVGHDETARTSSRLYLYAWALAHYVTFQQPLLASKRLDDYLKRGVGPADPIARFETFVGMPIEEFETRWRAAMLGL